MRGIHFKPQDATIICYNRDLYLLALSKLINFKKRFSYIIQDSKVMVAVLQAIERARSEVRTAECAVASLTEVCDSLRGDEADLRDRLHQLHRTAAAAEVEAASAVAGRDAACQVRNCSEPNAHDSVR